MQCKILQIFPSYEHVLLILKKKEKGITYTIDYAITLKA